MLRRILSVALPVIAFGIASTIALANFPGGNYTLHGVAQGSATLSLITSPGNSQVGTVDITNSSPQQHFVTMWDDANSEYILWDMNSQYAGEFQPYGTPPPFVAHTYDANANLIGDTYFSPAP